MRQNLPNGIVPGRGPSGFLSTATKEQLHRNVTIEPQGRQFREAQVEGFDCFHSSTRAGRWGSLFVQVRFQQSKCSPDGAERGCFQGCVIAGRWNLQRRAVDGPSCGSGQSSEFSPS